MWLWPCPDVCMNGNVSMHVIGVLETGRESMLVSVCEQCECACQHCRQQPLTGGHSFAVHTALPLAATISLDPQNCPESKAQYHVLVYLFIGL